MWLCQIFQMLNTIISNQQEIYKQGKKILKKIEDLEECCQEQALSINTIKTQVDNINTNIPNMTCKFPGGNPNDKKTNTKEVK